MGAVSDGDGQPSAPPAVSGGQEKRRAPVGDKTRLPNAASKLHGQPMQA